MPLSLTILLSTLVPIVLTVVIVAKVFGGLSKHSQDTQQLMATGLAAQGRVLGLSTTGMSIAVMGHRHLNLLLQVEVQMPGRPPYVAQFTQLVSELRLASLQPGAIVQLRIDPNNPNRMVVADGAPAPAVGAWPVAGSPAPGASLGAGAAGAWPGQPLPGAQPGASPFPAAGQGWGAASPAGFGANAGGVGPPPGGPPAFAPAPAPIGGLGFAGPSLDHAMKRSWRFAIIMLVVTTVPITAIMLAVFVDWSAIFGGDGAPKGGWCKGAARCCQVVHGKTAECENWKNFPGSGCETVYESYAKAAKSMGKQCK